MPAKAGIQYTLTSVGIAKPMSTGSSALAFAFAEDDRSQRKRPPGFPDDLSCPTAATHWRAISERLHRGPISRPCR